MKIIYQDTYQEIRKAIEKAEKDSRTIKKIIVTKKEMDDLYRQCETVVLEPLFLSEPGHVLPVISVLRRCAFCGVEVEEE